MFAVRAVVVGQTVARVAVDAVTTRAVVLTRVALALVRLGLTVEAGESWRTTTYSGFTRGPVHTGHQQAKIQ